jgi:hypothetical protein
MAIYLCNGAVAPLVLLLLACGAAGASDRYPADWNHVHQETLEHYTDILRMHTTNPPGNEPRSPVTSRTFSIANELPRNFLRSTRRANVVARINGNGSRKWISGKMRDKRKYFRAVDISYGFRRSLGLDVAASPN